MSLVTQLHDQRKALDYLRRELGEDNAYYSDIKKDFSRRNLFMFGTIFADTVLLVGAVAYYRIRYGAVSPFMTVVFLSVFVAINLVCAAFENSPNMGFWKWNRYYNLWLKYNKDIPSEVLKVFE